MKSNVWRGDRLHVMERKCSTCIFRPGNLMHLAPGRVESMVAECIAEQGTIACHKTLDGDQAICRGFFDTNKHQVALLSVAERMDLIEHEETR